MFLSILNEHHWDAELFKFLQPYLYIVPPAFTLLFVIFGATVMYGLVKGNEAYRESHRFDDYPRSG